MITLNIKLISDKVTDQRTEIRNITYKMFDLMD